MKVYSQLEKAQLENTTSDTANLPAGSVTYRTDTNIPKVSNGTAMKDVTITDAAQTLSAKTFGDAPTFTQVATPSNPASGFNKLYFKNDNLPYYLTSAGAEVAFAAGTTANESSLIENLGLSFSVAANALTINLKQANGTSDPTATNPVKIGFRSNTITSGAYATRSVTGALSVTIPSGASLGLTTGSNAYIYVYAIDNGGTVALGVNSIWLPDTRNTTFGLSAASTSATTGPAFVGGAAALSYRMIARLRYATAPNGTYTAVPDEVYLGTAPTLLLVPGVNAGAQSSFTTGTKTSTGTNTYLAMTNNSFTLQPGRWRVSAQVQFGNSGSPAYTVFAQIWTAANGNDTTTIPASLVTLTQLTLEQGGFSDPAGFGTPNNFQNVTQQNGTLDSTTIVFTLTQTATIFLVPRPTMTTAANTRVIGYALAERIN